MNTRREVKKYIDDDGREVIELIPIDDSSGAIVKGAIMLQVSLAGKTDSIRMEFVFPSGTSISGAFDSFDKVAGFEVEKFRNEQNKRAEEYRLAKAKKDLEKSREVFAVHTMPQGLPTIKPKV